MGFYSTFDPTHGELWTERHPNYKQSKYNKTCWLGLRPIIVHIWNWLYSMELVIFNLQYLHDDV